MILIADVYQTNVITFLHSRNGRIAFQPRAVVGVPGPV